MYTYLHTVVFNTILDVNVRTCTCMYYTEVAAHVCTIHEQGRHPAVITSVQSMDSDLCLNQGNNNFQLSQKQWKCDFRNAEFFSLPFWQSGLWLWNTVVIQTWETPDHWLKWHVHGANWNTGKWTLYHLVSSPDGRSKEPVCGCGLLFSSMSQNLFVLYLT